MTPGTELPSDSTRLESSLPRTVPSRVTSRSSDTLTLRSAPRRVADAPFSFSITALWILTRLTDRNFKYPAPATRIAATATITTRRNSFALRLRGGRNTCCAALLMRAGSAGSADCTIAPVGSGLAAVVGAAEVEPAIVETGAAIPAVDEVGTAGLVPFGVAVPTVASATLAAVT